MSKKYNTIEDLRSGYVSYMGYSNVNLLKEPKGFRLYMFGHEGVELYETRAQAKQAAKALIIKNIEEIKQTPTAHNGVPTKIYEPLRESFMDMSSVHIEELLEALLEDQDIAIEEVGLEFHDDSGG